MLPFRQITIEDKREIEEFFALSPARMTERCFADLFLWRERYRSRFAAQQGFLYVRSQGTDEERAYYLFPPGRGDLAAALDQIRRDAAARGGAYAIYGCPACQREAAEQAAPGQYRFIPDRDNYDYIYRRQDLAELKGKKFHAKRNFVNRFLQQYQGEWRYEPLDPGRHGEEMLALHRLWRQNRPEPADRQDYEGQAIRQALEYFQPLGMRGGVLYVRQRMAAFTLGCRSGPDTLTVQLEKALTEFPGAYPMINQQFIAHGGQDFDYVNREEDMGVEGLRKAKLSYHPVELTEKYLLEPIL